MLVILNGAPKGGSTWLMQIIKAMDMFEVVPDEFNAPGWKNSSICDEKIDLFFESFDLYNRQFYCKQHWHGSQKFINILKEPNVKMVNIIRDIRDVLVSRYFHDLRLTKNQEKDMTVYFKTRGKSLMRQYMNYQIFWHNSENKNQPFLCCYERLHANFESQFQELIEYLGLAYDPEEAIRIERETSFDRFRNKGEGNFFRKGIVGDCKNHMSDQLLGELHDLAIENGYLETKKEMIKNFNLKILKTLDFGIA